LSAALGIDLGLSGARAAVMARSGALLGTGRAGLPSAEGSVEGDPAAWLAAVLQAAQAALSAAGRPRIAALGIGALGPCPVLLDAAQRPLGPVPLFALDSRAESLRRELAARHGLDESALGPDHAIPKLAWLRERFPERFARASGVTDATGFLVAALTGQAVMDPVTQCDHVARGVPQPLPLPRLLAGDAIAGGLTTDAAAWLGLPAGTPVAAGSYDSYVDIAGTGTREAGDACVLLGSTLVLGCIATAERAPSGLRATPHLGPGWFIGGWTSSAGSLLRWSRALLGEPAAAAAAELPPGAAGLLLLPYFAGERAPHWDSRARGAIVGATLGTTAADLYRAALDAVALSARDLTSRLQEGGFPLPGLRATGGGARDAAWVQAVSDATGLALEVMAGAGEAVGPAVLAWRAMGVVVPSRIERRVLPDPRRRARYEALHALYRDLYPALAATLHGLGRLAQDREVA